MGLLDNLLDGVGAAADTGAKMLGDQIQQESRFQQQLKMLDAQLERQKAARLEKVKEVDAEAGQLAQGRSRGLIDAARTAYADNPEGLAAVEDAEKRGAYAQEVTAEDRIRAGAKLGYRDEMDVMRIEKDKEAGIRADREATVRAEDKKADNARADKQLEIAKQQLAIAAANGEITRQEHALRLKELEQQNDPAARALVTQGAEHLAKGDREGAIEAFRVAASHYGNKAALEQLIKLAPDKSNREAISAAKELLRTDPENETAKEFLTGALKGQAAPGTGGKPLSFASEKDVDAALKAGTLKVGDIVIVNGRKAKVTQ